MTSSPPKIAIIIDDMGNRPVQDERAVHLPGPVVCSILPYTPLAVELAKQAHKQHKEIILHTPMQAITQHYLGDGGLWLHEDKTKFVATLTADLHDIPYVQGINNHMGSLLTQSPYAMNLVMQTIKPYHLFFIDSLTSGRSVAEHIAEVDGIPTARRDVFLDDVVTPEAVHEQFQELLRVAKEKGSAIAIGHPYGATMEVLEAELPRLAAEGYELVPVSELLIKPRAIPVVTITHKSLFNWELMQDKTIFYKQLLAHEIKKWENFVQGQHIAKALYEKSIPVVTAISYHLAHQISEASINLTEDALAGFEVMGKATETVLLDTVSIDEKIAATASAAEQQMQGESFALFSKMEGEVLSSAAATEYQAKQIGGWLARIHTANLHFLNLEPAVWHKHIVEPDWHAYIAQAKQVERGAIIWTDVLEETLPHLKDWYAEYHAAQQLLDKKQLVASHGDLVQSNVIWRDKDSPYLIDWDSSGLVHPQVELLGVAINWSGVNTGTINANSFAAVLQGYQEQGGKVAINKTIFHAHLGSWLSWLEYNIKQVLNGQNAKDEIINTIKTMRFVVDLMDCLISYSTAH